VPRNVDAETAGRLLAATADGLDSMLYLGLVDREQARVLLGDSLDSVLSLA
jgi:hypothetical protein